MVAGISRFFRFTRRRNVPDSVVVAVDVADLAGDFLRRGRWVIGSSGPGRTPHWSRPSGHPSRRPASPRRSRSSCRCCTSWPPAWACRSCRFHWPSPCAGAAHRRRGPAVVGRGRERERGELIITQVKWLWARYRVRWGKSTTIVLATMV